MRIESQLVAAPGSAVEWGLRSVAARAAIVGFACSLLVALIACASPPFPSSEVKKNFIDGYPAFPPADSSEGSATPSAGDERTGLIHFVVEIPAGTNAKWEVDKATGGLHWEQKNGRPRVVQYLAYPGNYGMIPSTTLPYEIGGDGDPLDALLLGASLPRGSVVRARPIGILRLLDRGERDDKILAVQIEGPLSDVRDLGGLDAKYAGARTIIETWFTSYKGPGKIRSQGFGDVGEAMSVVEEASRYFDAK